jgi:hypothetical protein
VPDGVRRWFVVTGAGSKGRSKYDMERPTRSINTGYMSGKGKGEHRSNISILDHTDFWVPAIALCHGECVVDVCPPAFHIFPTGFSGWSMQRRKTGCFVFGLNSLRCLFDNLSTTCFTQSPYLLQYLSVCLTPCMVCFRFALNPQRKAFHAIVNEL